MVATGHESFSALALPTRVATFALLHRWITKMPYALFEDDAKLSQEFSTEQEVWQHADEAGLVDLVDGKTVLEDGYTIQPCSSDEATGKPIAVPPVVS